MHVAEQPSPESLSPSSHASPDSLLEFPHCTHVLVDVLVEPDHVHTHPLAVWTVQLDVQPFVAPVYCYAKPKSQASPASYIPSPQPRVHELEVIVEVVVTGYALHPQP